LPKEDREEALTARERFADERGRLAGERDLVAYARDAAADQRVLMETADERDRPGEVRDVPPNRGTPRRR
jgi:hypothetical protein